MAHRLSFKNGRAEFAYTGASPWHSLGERQGEHMTPGDAIGRVIPWGVALVPQSYEFNGVRYENPVDRAIIRTDTGARLGSVTDQYQPIQNAQAGEVADALIAEGAKCVETVGALDGGARAFMLLALDKTGFEVVKGDTVLPYFLLRWGHDGRTTLAGKLTNVRVVCHNTLTAAGSAFAFDVKHTASAKLRIDEAREALAVTRKAYVATREEYRALAGASISAAQAADYFRGVFGPVPADTEEERLARWNAVQARILSLYQGEAKGAQFAPASPWAAYNAVTEYIDHVYPVLQSGKVSADRQQSALFGAYADTRSRAYAGALALAK